MTEFTLMSEEEKSLWLNRKRINLSRLNTSDIQDRFDALEKGWQDYKEQVSLYSHPNDHADQEYFDAMKAAYVLNDYEKEILTDIISSSGSYLTIKNESSSKGPSGLDLFTSLGIKKSYGDTEYVEAYSNLINKNQLSPLEGFRARWTINWRGLRVHEKALELEKIEEEELEAVKGLGSFYNFDNVL